MGKTVRITRVEIIDDKDIRAFGKHNVPIKLTRFQRHLFTRYKKPDFLDQIYKEFSADILDEDFKIVEPLSGIPLYSRKKISIV